MTVTPTDLAVDALATARLARLVAADTFPPILRARKAIWDRWPVEGMRLDAADGWQFSTGRAKRWRRSRTTDMWKSTTVTASVGADASHAYVTDSHPIGELVSCQWCASAYIALGIVLARRYAGPAWGPIAKVLAGSEIAGLLSTHG